MPDLEEVDYNVRTPAKKKGPAPKPYSQRKYTPRQPIKRIERSYPKRKKEEVIIWMTHHRIELDDGTFKKPVLADASEFFKIPLTTIAGW